MVTQYAILQKRAHKAVERALKKGDLIRPQKCESCRLNKKLHAHHDDYEQPLVVRWLCRSCHSTADHTGENNIFMQTAIQKARAILA